ncbi:c-type cytochrome biogenesis protein CcmI [Tabrizicola sp.]|uniref:c-type cytochrome biogenesis protein CcmI n=1 Tax=Tabrizicola sp. TaxID=2005166 RepID=UPI003D2C234F
MDLWLFWAIAVVLTGMVGVLMVQALRRGGEVVAEHPDLKVYRDQLAEVDRDLARGTLQEDEAQRLRIEVSRRLLEADRALKQVEPPAPTGNIIWAGGLVLAVLGGSLWLYNDLGAPGYADLPLESRFAAADMAYKTRPAQAEVVASLPSVTPRDPGAEFTSLMDKLRAAVVERPDDAMGLELLARNEMALGNFDAAYEAQAKLLALLEASANPDQHFAAAQILIAQANGYVSPEAEAHLIDVLRRDPKHGMARYMVGLMFAQNDRADRAFELWQGLVDEGPQDAPWVAAARADIETAALQAGIPYTLPDPPALPGPNAEDMAAAQDLAPEDRAAMIEGMVGQLEERLMDKGGPVDEWVRLLNALRVLDQTDRGRAALRAGEVNLAADPAALKTLRDAAAAAGFAP